MAKVKSNADRRKDAAVRSRLFQAETCQKARALAVQSDLVWRFARMIAATGFGGALDEDMVALRVAAGDLSKTTAVISACADLVGKDWRADDSLQNAALDLSALAHTFWRLVCDAIEREDELQPRDLEAILLIGKEVARRAHDLVFLMPPGLEKSAA
jgi:hypothetical protein